ncbi:glycoside hydrolase family 117 protein [Pontiella agarivorans]|uniref:Family 43 glycosylhydrolase n=1 Tax=Pontiella agarivorans TaxID=3038953 RepID=A0ABU5MYB7_9BACT|nr:family 43 glycosylhydrolase [Pontiella agarivorans]MDZ8119071.1 family 43 glycosylhydrolase [Pontiella agarivorans]
MPAEKPPNRPLSAAMERAYDFWGIEKLASPHGAAQNDQMELHSNFMFSPLSGLSYENNTSRRDPSKVIKVDGTYYVWYTHRQTEAPPSGPELASDTVPSADWDLAEIWYATSTDGFTWEEQGVAVPRPPKPEYGWRSVTTTDILVYKGKYYLYYQGFNAIPFTGGGDVAAVTVSEADSPRGPWRPLGKVVVDFGAEDEWDAKAIHDPYPMVYKGKIYLYYKGQPVYSHGSDDGLEMVRAQGVAIADHPLGPFTKHPLNPVINSGHETSLFPWKGGVAAIVSLDGPEKNTIQYAPDGVNFEIMSTIEMPPLAPGPFVADAFADNGDGRGITWGLCHIPQAMGDSQGLKWAEDAHFTLARFDCDLSLDVHRPAFKRTYPGRYDAEAYFSSRAKLSGNQLNQVKKEQRKIDRETIMVAE